MRMSYTFNPQRPPEDEKRRALWSLVGEGEYQTERNTGWIFTYFGVPLFGVLTVIVFVVAVVRGAAEWMVFGVVAAAFAGTALVVRSWRRSAGDLRRRLDRERRHPE